MASNSSLAINPAQITAVESPADKNATWFCYLCCAGVGMTCTDQCNPLCKSETKHFNYTMSTMNTCNALCCGPDGMYNSSTFMKCGCCQAMSQSRTNHFFGEYGCCNCSSANKHCCCLSTTGCKTGGLQFAFNNGCCVHNSKLWVCLTGFDLVHKMFFEICGVRICGHPKANIGPLSCLAIIFKATYTSPSDSLTA
jgi:hypothetical protein